MNQRQYESALKDLLEEVALALGEYDPDYLDDLHMPQNVPGVPRISLNKWLDSRYEKRVSVRDVIAENGGTTPTVQGWA